MSARFKYIPRVTKTVNETSVQYASFSFVIRDNGLPIDLQPFYYKDDKISLQISRYDYASCYGSSQLSIQIPLCSKVKVIASGADASAQLMKVKDEIPRLVNMIKDDIKFPPFVDLATGKPLEHKLSVDYCFEDEVITKHQREKLVSPGQVIFDCLSTEKLIKVNCKEGVLRYPGFGPSTSKIWNIACLGIIQVPEQIQWSEEEIREAFMELAKQLLSQPEIPGAQIWKAKEVVQISLE